MLKELKKMGIARPPRNRRGLYTDPRLRRNLLPWGVTLLLFVLPGALVGQETADYFRANCMSCHTIGGGRLVGPDLKNVADRADHDWLVNFIVNPTVVLNSGDAYAAKLQADASGAVMPKVIGLDRDQAERLLELIASESLLEQSAFSGLSIGDEPFTRADIDRGKRLFLGTQRLSNGGPACLSCHSTTELAGLGGGRLGPDLSRVYERLQGRKSLAAWLQAPATEVMRPVYRNHALSNEEIVGLVAYLEERAQAGGEAPQTSQAALLVLGLLGSALAFFLADMAWKNRFRGVRIPLVRGDR